MRALTVRRSSARARLAALLAGSLPGLLAGCKADAPTGAPSAAPTVAPSVPPAGAPAPAAGVPAPKLTWDARSSYVYALTMKSRMDVGGQGARVDFALGSELRLTPIASEPDAATFYVELRAVRITSAAGGDQTQFDQLAMELGRPFLATLTKGRLTELRVRPGQSRFAASIAQTALATLQLSAADGTATPKGWTSHEYDPTGEYVAEYEAAGPGVFTKRKAKYVHFAMVATGESAVELMPKVVSSEGRVELAQGRLRSITTTDRLEIGVGKASPPFASLTTVSLVLAREEPVSTPPAWQAIAASAIQITPSAPYIDPPKDTDLDAARIGDLTFAQAVALAEAQERDPKRTETWGSKNGEPVSAEEKAVRQERLRESSRVFFALVAWFRQEPKDLERGVAAIRKRSPAANVLMDAMSSAGTPAAQATLLKLMGDAKLSAEIRKDAGLSLIRTKAATDTTIRTLQGLMDDPLLSSHAIYGLGTMARRRREAGDVKMSTELSELLLARLTKATGALAKVEFLRGIANAAYPGALQTLQRFVEEDKDESVRRAGLEALALIHRPEIDPLIAKYLNEESRIRLAALDAARVREPSDVLAAGIDRVAREATDRQSRLECLRIIERWLPHRPELKATLERLASADPDETIRKVAQATLASHARAAVQ